MTEEECPTESDEGSEEGSEVPSEAEAEDSQDSEDEDAEDEDAEDEDAEDEDAEDSDEEESDAHIASDCTVCFTIKRVYFCEQRTLKDTLKDTTMGNMGFKCIAKTFRACILDSYFRVRIRCNVCYKSSFIQ